MFGIGAGIILVLVIGSFVLIRMKCQSAQANDPRSNKNYHHSEAINAATRDKLNPNSHPPPPDLWIGHDQLELKDISDQEPHLVHTILAKLREAAATMRKGNFELKSVLGHPFFHGGNFAPGWCKPDL